MEREKESKAMMAGEQNHEGSSINLSPPPIGVGFNSPPTGPSKQDLNLTTLPDVNVVNPSMYCT